VTAARFDAASYERGRPGWPAAAVARAIERLGLEPAAPVLDLGAGTGKLTERLAERFDDIVAVEPLDAMRARIAVPGVRVLAGTAEAIPLPDVAVAAVFVGEALHWFDGPRAAAEITRVLRPGGGLAALWNVEAWDGPWVADVRALLAPHRDAAGRRRDTVPWLAERFEDVRDDEVAHVHHTDVDGFVALVASFSWIGRLPDTDRSVVLAAVRTALERHRVEAVALPYCALVTTARAPRSSRCSLP
jgi:SAM-dependent methyltransferase